MHTVYCIVYTLSIMVYTDVYIYIDIYIYIYPSLTVVVINNPPHLPGGRQSYYNERELT